MQVNEGVVFEQLAFALQLLPPPGAHSSMSVQVKPLPRYPGAQAHPKEPGVFEQTAWASHGLFTHSFTSAQVTPLPL